MLSDIIITVIVITLIVWHVFLLKKFRKALKQHIPFSIKDLICLLIVNFIVAFVVLLFNSIVIGSIIVGANDAHPLIGMIQGIGIMYNGIIASGILAAIGDIIIGIIYAKHNAKIKNAKDNQHAIEVE